MVPSGFFIILEPFGCIVPIVGASNPDFFFLSVNLYPSIINFQLHLVCREIQ